MSMRIGGLASGIDTDEIIRKLMSAHRMPFDKLKQQKQLLEWKRDDYRSLNTKILAFRDAAFNMKLQSSYLTKSVSSSDSNTISATASPNAANGSYSIKVNQLARGAALGSADLAGDPGETKTMADLGLTEDATLTIGGNKGTAVITINTSDKISDFLTKFNAKLSETGVSVSYNKTGDTLLFMNSQTGTASNISLKLQRDSDPAPTFTLLQSVFGFDNSAETADSTGVYIEGRNAVVEINGVSNTFDSNTFSIADMTVTVKQENASAVNLTVSQDVDGLFNNIKSFVDKYNELIEEINKKLSEKRYRDFQPLTEKQRKEMSEDEVKKWEEKARSGMLSNDSLLSNGLSSFRLALSNVVSGIVDGQYKSLSEIGISSTLLQGITVSGNFLDKGKLYIDETKLKAAIAERPDEVMSLFTRSDNDNSSDSGDGIAQRLHTHASALINQITSKAGTTASIESRYSIGKEMLEYDSRIQRLARRLDDLETRYYKQFTAMETYINRMNSQSAWLAQQFSTGG